MQPKDIRFAQDAREGIARGVDVLANAVRVTLGPKGRNVVIGKGSGTPRMTKDGVTVAKDIDLSDPFENMGAQMIRAVASRAHEDAGDGTTTATVLAQAILSEGMTLVAAGANPVDLKRGIDLAIVQVVADLRAHARPVAGTHEIAQIGTISANGDTLVGDRIAQAMERVGTDGVISVEQGNGLDVALTVVEGMQFDRGYLSPHFVTDAQKMTVEFDNPHILIHEKKLATLRSLLPILEAVVQSERPLLIIAEEIEAEALSTLVVNKMRGSLHVAAVRAPGFGERRKAMLEDIAALTGGQVIAEETGTKLENVTLAMLGSARRVSIDKDATTIVDGAGSPEAIQQRIGTIRARIDATSSLYDAGQLQERLAKLTGGVAVITIGGSTEVEVRELKDRVDDALCATRAAVEEGIVPGGGAALLHATRALDGMRGENEDQTSGIAIIRRALEAPLRQIARNAGVHGGLIASHLLASPDRSLGYNALTESYEDLVQSGVIDPAKVVRCALQAAASIAGLLITTQVAVAQHA